MINATSPEYARSLSDLIPAEFIQKALTLTDTVTLRKRKLPLESMDGVVWRTADTPENSAAFSR